LTFPRAMENSGSSHSHYSQASEQHDREGHHNPRAHNKPVSSPPPAPAVEGTFFAGSRDFQIQGGQFQHNGGNSVTNVSHDNSTNSDFNNQHGDFYGENSYNASTNFNGGYYDNRTHRSASASMNTYQFKPQYSPFGRGSARNNMGWGGSGRGRSPELLRPARGTDRGFHSAPAGIPQTQRGSGFGGPGHRPGITDGVRYDLNRPNQRFDPDYYTDYYTEEYAEENEEDYRDDQFYDAECEQMWPPEETYPMEQDHTEPAVPPRKTGAYKSNNPFAAGTGS